MCQTLACVKVSQLLLDYFNVLFSERFLHNVYDKISDNFMYKVQASGGKVVMCYFLVPLSNMVCLFIDPFPKCRKLVHNGGFPKFEALYCSLNMVNLIEFS